MKSKTLFRTAWTASMAAMVGTLLFLNACKDEETNKPAPTLSVSSASTSELAGAVVTTTVSVNAPEGGKTLSITVNGASDAGTPSVTLDGSANQDVVVTYTIPASAVVGATYLLTFQATDNKNQASPVVTFLVTVSDQPNKEIVDVPAGSITVDTHWTSDKIYRLNGFVRIGSDTHSGPGDEPEITATATLTIDAGTVIYGKTGTPGGTLIVQRGSKIIAIGTADNPIVFTSERAPGSRVSGDWGGLVICGKAINNTTGSASTGTNGVEELEGAYGGFHGGGGAVTPNDNDDSGSLQYVRIEFAGYPINPNQELNGLTLGSVGAATDIDHVQVSFSNDDSFEWFGGKVNCNNLIAFKGLDDDFDVDNGYSGQVQFGLAIREPNTADQSGSNGFESDNNASGSPATPFTNGTFSNMTIIGAKSANNIPMNIQFQNGAQLRRNTKMDIINSFFTAFPNGIYIDNAAAGAIANATAGDLVVRDNVVAGVENWGGNGFGSIATADEQTVVGIPYGSNTNHPTAPRGLMIATGVGSFSSGVFTLGTPQQISAMNGVPWFQSQNILLSKWTDTSLKIDASVFNPTTAPTLLPGAGSSLLTGADFTGYTGFTAVNHIGAFGATDWTTGGWVDWNPQTTDYSK